MVSLVFDLDELPRLLTALRITVHLRRTKLRLQRHAADPAFISCFRKRAVVMLGRLDERIKARFSHSECDEIARRARHRSWLHRGEPIWTRLCVKWAERIRRAEKCWALTPCYIRPLFLHATKVTAIPKISIRTAANRFSRTGHSRRASTRISEQTLNGSMTT